MHIALLRQVVGASASKIPGVYLAANVKKGLFGGDCRKISYLLQSHAGKQHKQLKSAVVIRSRSSV
jgi:hypothetical protein